MHILIQVFGTLSLFVLFAYGIKDNSTNGTSKQVLVTQRISVPRGYFLYPDTDSYYKFHTDIQTWAEARSICEAEGGYLTIINSQEEASFLVRLMSQYPLAVLDPAITEKEYFIFIGFHDWFRIGEWVTIDGKSLISSGYVHWKAGEPNNAGGWERCGSFYVNGGLNDLNCDFLQPFVCEIPANICNEF